jgi:signal recognition particle subunit SRP54
MVWLSGNCFVSYLYFPQVLAELGLRITGALRKLHQSAVISDELLDTLLKEICAALLESDVNVKMVFQLRTNIKNIANMEELAAGTNKRKLIQNAIFSELVNMLDPGKEPYKLVKGYYFVH